MIQHEPLMHLPLDENRIDGLAACAPNVGSGDNAIAHGNPLISHDPEIGTCMRFDGDNDFIELADIGSASFAQGLTVMAWVRFEETPYYSRIFDLNVAANQKSNTVWAGNVEQSGDLAFEIDGIRFSVEDGIALRQWRHYAFVYDPHGVVSVLIDGATAFSKEVSFDIVNRSWKTGFVGKSSYAADHLFRGTMAQFRLYNDALAPTEINELMITDRSAMAHYRETTLLKADLYTVCNDDHKPVLYVEADNTGEPLELSLTNPTDKPIAFKSFQVPTADDFHIQLRFRRNVIAPSVLKSLRSDNGVSLVGWHHAAGTAADGREDYISFVKSEGPFDLGKGDAWRIRIPDFAAAAQGGARNTRIQVRYRTEPQDPGSVVRHMEVQSHLGLKTVPLIARFLDSNTILNNGTKSNVLTIEVVYTGDTGSVLLDADSKFELIVDDDLISVEGQSQTLSGNATSGSNLEAVSGTSWFEAQPAAQGIGHKTIIFKAKLPEVRQARDEALQALEVKRGQAKIVFKLSSWVTNKPSGTYSVLLRYENIPGFWDGAWVLPVEFSPLVRQGDKIGIGTGDPSTDLEIRRDMEGSVGPVLRLTNGKGTQGSCAAIDFNVGPHGLGPTHDPAFRIEGRNNVDSQTDLVMSSIGSIDAKLHERLRITSAGEVSIGTGTGLPQTVLNAKGDVEITGSLRVGNGNGNDDDLSVAGRIRDKTGDVMPVGAIIAFGGYVAPKGWLLCDGQTDIAIADQYQELRDVLKRNQVPDLRNRFILCANGERRVHQPGGEAEVTLTAKQMPSHSHPLQRAIYVHGRGFQGSDDKDGTLKDQNTKGTEWTIRDVGSAGGSQPHNNMPPFYALTYIIKY